MEFLSLKKRSNMRITLHVYQSSTANTHIHLLHGQISLHVNTKAVLRGTLQQHGLRAVMFSRTMAQVLQSTSDVDLMLRD